MKNKEMGTFTNQNIQELKKKYTKYNALIA